MNRNKARKAMEGRFTDNARIALHLRSARACLSSGKIYPGDKHLAHFHINAARDLIIARVNA